MMHMLSAAAPVPAAAAAVQRATRNSFEVVHASLVFLRNIDSETFQVVDSPSQ